MKSAMVKFFSLQRQIFGICPNCSDFFRLSGTNVFLKRKPAPDWMDKIDKEEERLTGLEEKLEEKKGELQEKAREKGRKLAQKAIRKIDPVFAPRKLNADDAKVIFHPIDYIVFRGMKDSGSIKGILLLDRQAKEGDHRAVQKSIEKVVEHENYEWQTLRVQEDGKIKAE